MKAFNVYLTENLNEDSKNPSKSSIKDELSHLNNISSYALDYFNEKYNIEFEITQETITRDAISFKKTIYSASITVEDSFKAKDLNKESFNFINSIYKNRSLGIQSRPEWNWGPSDFIPGSRDTEFRFSEGIKLQTSYMCINKDHKTKILYVEIYKYEI